MKKFYVLIILLLLFTFAGCTNVSNNEAADIVELSEKIANLETKISQLEKSHENYLTEITNLKNQIAALEESLSALKAQINAISYQLKVYDIDGECLGDKEVIASSEDEFFDVLKENFAVEYTLSSWGPMLTSINNSVVDPNYYLAIYVNGLPSPVGVGSIEASDEDVFEFRVECWNQEFDELDREVDKLIYSYLKNVIPSIFNQAVMYYDYTLTAALQTMIKNNYDKNIFNFEFSNSQTIKKALEEKDWNSETVQNNFMKGGITLLALEGDVSGLKTALEKQTKYNYWQTIVTKALEIDNAILTSTINDFEIPTTGGDASLMKIPVYALFMSTDELGRAFLDATVLTSDGVDSYGVNSASTAQFILACCSLGLNPREFYYQDKIEEKYDVVEMLLKYSKETGFIWNLTSSEVDLAFSTPQAISALLAYKVLRDTNKQVLIFEL